MSTTDIVREIAAELAANSKKQVTGWRWAKGVVPLPEIRCPYCKQGVKSRAVWKHTETALIGAAQLVPSQTPEIGTVEHPHARTEWPGQTICMGNATTAHQALFGALNPKYTKYTVPFLKSDIMGNHTCDKMPAYDGAFGEEEEEEGVLCEACGVDTGDDYYAFGDYYYCTDCFSERAFYCESCRDDWPKEDGKVGADGCLYCDTCWNRSFFECYYCVKTFDQNEKCLDVDNAVCCSDCWTEKFFDCEKCNDVTDNDERSPLEEPVCQDCYDKALITCLGCEVKYHPNSEDANDHEEEVCDECVTSYYLCAGEHQCV